MTDEPIWITESEVTETISLADALVALEQGLLAEGHGQAHNVPKALGRWSVGGAMHCLGAMMPDAGFVGWKAWAVTPKGGGPTYTLFDAETGSLRAVIQSTALGQLRTAAMTGIGTKWLAPANADSLALIGVGRQALAQVAAIHAVRPLRSVLVFSREANKRMTLRAKRIEQSLSIAAKPAPSLEAAVGSSAITTLITRAEHPFLTAAMLPLGAHLNAVGAILPSHAEFSEDVFGRASLIAVDSIADVQKNSREFIEHFGTGDWSPVRSIGTLVADAVPRPAASDVTLFKAMGMGISDLSVAIEVYARVRSTGLGTPLSASGPSAIRWN